MQVCRLAHDITVPGVGTTGGAGFVWLRAPTGWLHTISVVVQFWPLGGHVSAAAVPQLLCHVTYTITDDVIGEVSQCVVIV
jgi:hypothetical protein